MTEIRAIGERTNNAELMVDCHQLGYLPDNVLDLTYGTGRFWKLYRPPFLTTNDLFCKADSHDDFRATGYCAHQFAAVVFDPPYKLNGTATGVGPSALDEGYGVGVSAGYSSVAAKMDLILDGVTEAARLSSRYVLVKCQDQVVSGNVVWQTHDVARHAGSVDLRLVDMLHVQGYRAQPEGRRQLHARRDYSTLLVFEVR